MTRTSFVSWALVALALASTAQAQNPSAAERFAPPNASIVERENRYWKRTPLPVPDEIVLEVSGILPVPKQRLLVVTRRGEIWWVDGAYEADPKPRFSLFASGLHEPLGIAAAPGGGYYVAQRQEVTLITDTDGDGRADVFKTIYRIPIGGSYHEYAFGPVVTPGGNLLLTLNVAFGGATQSPVPWRGWAVELTPDGQMTPVAAGLRSPADLLLTSKGAWLYSENQGEWAGSGRVTEIQRGDFMGHPASLAWSKLPGSPVKLRPEDVSKSGQPMQEVLKSMPGLKRPTVWLPHTIFGISTAGLIEDRSGGKFGPFAGQVFVGDQGQSKIMRMNLEKVKGVWQGAAHGFREGFESGVLRLAMGEEGVLFAGETARGWGSVGPKQQGIERLAWTGEMPFEVQEITAQPDGFLLKFTRPVDPETAGNPASYSVAGFTYKYHSTYGSAPVNRVACPIRKAVVSADGLTVRLGAVCLREGYVHEIKVTGVRSARGAETVMHPTAYYTMNEFPDGERIIPFEPMELEICVAPVPASANAESRKHPINAPADWKKREGERTLLVGTLPGLKFDQEELIVTAGETVQLVFRNSDDMLHNFVLCAPGRGQAVGAAAMTMGIDGAASNYVPDTADVLYHTALTLPESTDRIFFTAPSVPGDYDYICSFPGHATLMKGVLRVRAK